MDGWETVLNGSSKALEQILGALSVAFGGLQKAPFSCSAAPGRLAYLAGLYTASERARRGSHDEDQADDATGTTGKFHTHALRYKADHTLIQTTPPIKAPTDTTLNARSTRQNPSESGYEPARRLKGKRRAGASSPARHECARGRGRVRGPAAHAAAEAEARTHHPRPARAGTGGAREEDRESLPEIKPLTASAIQAPELRRKDIYERAGVGKETLRRALYGRAGNRAARDIAGAWAEAAQLSRDEAKAVETELKTAPDENFKNFLKIAPITR